MSDRSHISGNKTKRNITQLAPMPKRDTERTEGGAADFEFFTEVRHSTQNVSKTS